MEPYTCLIRSQTKSVIRKDQQYTKRTYSFFRVVPVNLEANERSFTSYALLDSSVEITVLQRNALKFLGLNPPIRTMEMDALHEDVL